MKKKILSMVMAAALVMSVSSVSQAAEITPNAETGKYEAAAVEAEGTYEAPTIKVTLSDTSNKKVAINPYGLEVSTVTGVTVAADKKEQLVNKIESITNDSDVALAVNATLTATPSGKTKIATAAVNPETEKSNSVFAFLKMDLGSAVATSVTADKYDAKDDTMAAFTSKATTKKAMVVLDPTSGTNKVASYKILGSVAANPTTPWTAANGDDKGDGVDFKIVFDFEPKMKSGS